MVVQLICNQQVIGSSPTGSSFWSYSEMVITSACHAKGPSSILGNSVKMLTAKLSEELEKRLLSGPKAGYVGSSPTFF